MPTIRPTTPAVSPSRKPPPANAPKISSITMAMTLITIPSMSAAPTRLHQPASCHGPPAGKPCGV